MDKIKRMRDMNEKQERTKSEKEKIEDGENKKDRSKRKGERYMLREKEILRGE